MLRVSLNIGLKRTGRMLLYIFLLSMPYLVMAQDDEEEVTVDTMVSETPTGDRTITTIQEDTDYEQEKVKPAPPELRQVPDSAVNRMKQEEAFAYANDPEYWSKKKQAEEEEEDASDRRSGFWYNFYRFFADSTVRMIMYIILGVVFVLIIYRVIVVNNLYMTGASRRRKEEAITEEREIDDENLDQKIQSAIREGNYRSAIRFMYIKSLRSLHEKGWIRYHAQATNYEYINQVHPYGIGNEFRFLTHVYEYVWYGEFALSEDQFNRVQQNFQHFFNTVKP
ncbi:DUF4129 domain-containing protein [Pseudoflavitalea sp. X16]|uniref:DUF4129 domain-containing protein n=1 Tax=Paraflavitalea devenefica TaxID=2716334 RepID=UPI00142397F9|nr:DUF4129 domain-containing protein [Paraflavitalea devenefica]NII25730.1 DUF4129 domain-containing protein [Paraflavitalea devenefica]